MIYLKGFKAKPLTALLDFMYNGVADIYQDDLETFLTMAEELQLKGLKGGLDEMEDPEPMEDTYTERFRNMYWIFWFNQATL